MNNRGVSWAPWLVTAGAVAAAWHIWQDAQQPLYPDIALEAGLELVSRPHRVLAIGPHPNDLEALAGGTLKLLTEGHSAVTMAVLSRGEAATNRANIGEIRTKEAEAGATILGANLIQLSLPDGEIEDGPRLEEALDDLWRRTRPDVVLAFDPKGLAPFGNHPDHIALGAALLARVRQGIPGGAERVYFYGTARPNVLVDITEVLEEKMSALKAHRSQLLGPDGAVDTYVRQMSRLHHGTPAIYTEGFYRLV